MIAGWILAVVADVSAADFTGRKPNIVFVMTDDQGYGDISAHGNPILKTPNLDRLHAEGVRFTDFHVSPTCSPTRSSLMTGRHEFSNGVTHTILERERMSLGDDDACRKCSRRPATRPASSANGISATRPSISPNRRGFDEVFIHGGGGIGQTYPGSCGDAPGNKYFDPAILHNGKFEKTKGYCTDVFFAQAQKWIEAQAKCGAGQERTQPFFCYIATNAPHGPLDVPAGIRSPLRGQGAQRRRREVLRHDREHRRQRRQAARRSSPNSGIERDTLVIFMNDNGGTAGMQGLQRRHARPKGNAVSRRHARRVVLALAGHA